MTAFMMAHPYLFTFQVGFVCLLLATISISIASNSGGSVRDVHHHYNYNPNGENKDGIQK